MAWPVHCHACPAYAATQVVAFRPGTDAASQTRLNYLRLLGFVPDPEAPRTGLLRVALCSPCVAPFVDFLTRLGASDVAAEPVPVECTAPACSHGCLDAPLLAVAGA